jgi:hypothetical protein
MSTVTLGHAELQHTGNMCGHTQINISNQHKFKSTNTHAYNNKCHHVGYFMEFYNLTYERAARLSIEGL